MASVTLSSLHLQYPSGAVGLEDIDLTVGHGEFVALVGASGSGKTTLLRTVAGFLSPTSGTVRLGDRVVAGDGVFVPAESRHLGMVFQQHAVWPHMNVARNVEYPLRRARVGRAERTERVERMLELVGLGGYAKRDPATLSGGQRQRVALARALVAEPSVLLLDEALSALDEPLRDRLRLELQSLTRSLGLTVLHVTHDRDEALALADRVVVLDGGRIQQIGTPPELVSEPASAAVARFLSDATVVAGTRTATGFRADGFPVDVPAALLSGAATGDVEVAILPEDVDLVAPGPAADGVAASAGPGAESAVVVSSLYGRSGNDVILDWGGLTLRSRTADHRPVVGERVGVSIRRALVFPSAGAAVPSAAPAAGARV
ncbi:ABC transporter ATP-binding protein [Labedella endophytica]|uniref:ABC-type quaternary amine transporter n=1 Tax=Labedella endophytica TaxID=1523160 RepID=A0A3S1CQ06_9MICO|nr:ABC transporter ATP-binding protein [Labedella endophytica]RUQ98203.1 ABC transporter ATP-binding protein [Labedella endophytica]